MNSEETAWGALVILIVALTFIAFSDRKSPSRRSTMPSFFSETRPAQQRPARNMPGPPQESLFAWLTAQIKAFVSKVSSLFGWHLENQPQQFANLLKKEQGENARTAGSQAGIDVVVKRDGTVIQNTGQHRASTEPAPASYSAPSTCKQGEIDIHI